MTNPWAVIFKNQYKWGLTKKDALHAYIGIFISEDEYKDIVGEGK